MKQEKKHVLHELSSTEAKNKRNSRFGQDNRYIYPRKVVKLQPQREFVSKENKKSRENMDKYSLPAAEMKPSLVNENVFLRIRYKFTSVLTSSDRMHSTNTPLNS